MTRAGRLYVVLFGGPADGHEARIYESTEEVHIPVNGRTERYVRQPDGVFKYAGPADQ